MKCLTAATGGAAISSRARFKIRSERPLQAARFVDHPRPFVYLFAIPSRAILFLERDPRDGGPVRTSRRPRSRHLFRIVGAAGLTVVVAAQPSPRPALFTEAQAAGGEAIYAKSCASCHGTTLAGGSAPSLVGARFEQSWSDPRITLDDLFFVMRTTMPPRASSSLTAQEHAAVFAFILKTNGFAAGSCLSGSAQQR